MWSFLRLFEWHFRPKHRFLAENFTQWTSKITHWGSRTKHFECIVKTVGKGFSVVFVQCVKQRFVFELKVADLFLEKSIFWPKIRSWTQYSRAIDLQDFRDFLWLKVQIHRSPGLTVFPAENATFFDATTADVAILSFYICVPPVYHLTNEGVSHCGIKILLNSWNIETSKSRKNRKNELNRKKNQKAVKAMLKQRCESSTKLLSKSCFSKFRFRNNLAGHKLALNHARTYTHTPTVPQFSVFPLELENKLRHGMSFFFQ